MSTNETHPHVLDATLPALGDERALEPRLHLGWRIAVTVLLLLLLGLLGLLAKPALAAPPAAPTAQSSGDPLVLASYYTWFDESSWTYDKLSDLPVDRFVTMVMAVLDPNTHEVTIVNAGHMAPIYRNVEGAIAEPGEDDSGLPLGIAEGMEYEQLTLSLASGESLTMYTDGLNEAMNANNECFGIERIQQHVKAAAGELETVGSQIISDIRQFVGQGDQEDDMCLVAFRRSGLSGASITPSAGLGTPRTKA